MTSVEVLVPLRLETRFVPPGERTDGVDEWMLRVRIYPDEVSIRRTVAPPSPAELDRLEEAVARISAVPPLPVHDAFASVAAVVGADRAFLLWRRCVVDDGAGDLRVDRSAEAEHVPFQAHGPAGLPEQLELWLVHTDGSRQRAAVLDLDLAGIGADLDLAVFQDEALLATGELPQTWWLWYPRAVEVRLGVDLDVGAAPPDLEALVVVGVGSTDAAVLVDEHNAGNRLAVLPAGTPTNTVAGQPTTDLGGHAASLFPLLDADPARQTSTVAVLSGLTGRLPDTALPMLNGDHDHHSPGSLAVRGLWPVLWGRALRDVTGAGETEPDAATWAGRHLAVEGPRPAFRVGDQPYGLLPTSTFGSWSPEPGDDEAAVEERILRWALPWRSGAAQAARGANRRVHGARTDQLVAVLGVHAPSRHWRVRPVADLPLIQAWRAMAGMAGMPASDWDRFTASAWRDWPYPFAPIGAAARGGPTFGPPDDEADEGATLQALVVMDPEPLYYAQELRLGLVGHLFREALVSVRAIAGEAYGQLAAGDPVRIGVPLPLDDEDAYSGHVMRGSDEAVAALEGAQDDGARAVARRFRDVQEALRELAEVWDAAPTAFFRGVLAALDTAASRVDPWLTGIAERRLQRMAASGAPFTLGAYGWVDAPAPYDAGGGPGPAALAPGPTTAGLLHAPSPAQALTAALLRDAAVRYPGEDRWQLTIDSAKVRASVALAERVRLGVHPYEALGLEVEKLAGDWDTVRILRTEYPLAPDQQVRRVCDGAQVLRAAREGGLAAVPGLPPDLTDRLAPLDEVLDTYADLLVADGIHALVTGRGDLANAAMEAGSGLGAPPDLRAIRTPRSATTVRVAAWALLPPGGGADDDASEPVRVADPAFAALLDRPDADEARLALLLGGGDESVVPSLTGGSYEGLPGTANDDLRRAVIADLTGRLGALRDLAERDRAAIGLLDAADPGIAAAAGRWRIEVAPDLAPEDAQAAVIGGLGDRLASTAALPPLDLGPGAGSGASVSDAAVTAVRQAIRTLAGRAELPVLPVVDAGLLPTLRPQPEVDRVWLELVAAVRPRLATLEAHQFETPWAGSVASSDGSDDPWSTGGPVLVAYSADGAEIAGGARVAIAALDAWSDSVPSRRHATTAAFGFNAPKSRAAQAVLLAVPPDVTRRLDNPALLEVVLETRELTHARAARPQDRDGLPYASPAPLVHAAPASLGFLNGWPG